MNAGKTNRRSKKRKVKPAAKPGRPPPSTQASGGLQAPPTLIVAACAALALVAAYGFGIWMLSDSPKLDERIHYSQIQTFAGGRFDIHPHLTMLPGYHAVVACIAWLRGDFGPEAVRAVSQALCVPAVALFFLCARELGKHNRLTLTLVFLLSPIVFPFFFLIYTDIPSLMFLLGALLLTLQRRYRAAGLVAVLSLLLRQSNVIWVFLYALIALHREGALAQLAKRDWRSVLHTLGRLWLFVLAGLAFAAFVYWHGGVALGDADKHEVGLYPLQVYFLLLTVFFLFVPLHIRNLPRIGQMLARHPLAGLLIAALSLALYLATFQADHPYNQFPGVLRTQVLNLMKDSYAWRIAAFIPMLWALCSLCVTPLQRRSFYCLYPVAILSVLPVGLIELRYFIVPATLFMLARKHENTTLDLLTLALYAPATGVVYYRINNLDWFI